MIIVDVNGEDDLIKAIEQVGFFTQITRKNALYALGKQVGQ